MKLTLPRNVSNLKSVEELGRYTQIAFDDLDGVVNGGIQFGQNINANQLDVTFITANSDTVVQHGLGKLPTGFFVVGNNSASIIYNSPTASTSDVLYLRCNVAGTVAKVMVY